MGVSAFLGREKARRMAGFFMGVRDENLALSFEKACRYRSDTYHVVLNMKVNAPAAPSPFDASRAEPRQPEPTALPPAISTPIRADASALHPSTIVTLGSTSSRPGNGYPGLLGALTALRQSTSSSSPQRKAAARARVTQIKQQIEQMQKFAVGLDPQSAKAMAVQIRMLAQQLRAAASELSGADGAAPTMPNPTVVAGQDDSATTTDQADAASASTSDSTPDSTAADASAVAADASATSQQLAQEGSAQSTAQDDAGHAAHGQHVASSPSSNDESAADRGLVQEAASKLKALLALLRSQLRHGRNPDADDADQTLRSIDKMMEAGGSDSATVTAASAAAADTSGGAAQAS